ncbi:MAG: hypothetical protein M1823_005361 [Watsoniomyces obsoletus]|nr:MAG: hypothetical protein M1823_005361 [Watsoniomyces obsoletus]
MDAASCVIAAIQITGTVINLCYHYRKGVKSASKDIARITDELKTLRTVLEQLLQLAEEDDRLKNARGLCEPGGPLCDCRTLLEELQKKLNPPDGFRASIVRVAMWPLREAELEKILVRIGSFKQTFTLALGGDQARMILKVDDGVTSLAKSFESERSTREREQIFAWLRAPDPSGSHGAKRRERQPDTGQWLLDCEQYADWKSTPNSFMWLHGIPGCGKSILFSTAAQDVIDSCISQKQQAIAYFYFCFSEQIKIKNDNLVRSLISQLSFQSPDIPEVVKALYKRYSSVEQQPSAEELKALLPPIIRSFGKTYIMVDALDECTEWPELLSFITELYSCKIDSLHLLVTSRKEKEITDALDPLEPVELSLQSHLLDPDIRLHVRRTVASDPKCKKWPCEVREEVEVTLVEKANGMFRWVQCQLQELRKCISNSKVRTALHRLPQTLDETYDRILLGIDDEYKADVLKILQWLCYAYCPLRLCEVAEVLTVDLKANPYVDFDRRPNDPFDLLRVCGCLVILEPRTREAYSTNSIMRLAHFSVKEYLVSDRIQSRLSPEYGIQPISAHALIAESCLTYLVHLSYADRGPGDAEEDYPLLSYVVRYWTRHYREVEARVDESATVMDGLALKMIEDRRCFDLWGGVPGPRYIDFSTVPDGPSQPLRLASSQGFYYVVSLLLDRGVDANWDGGENVTPLQTAAAWGRERVVDILLKNGADVNLVSGRYGTALQAAAAWGRDRVADILLKNGADVDLVSGQYGTALQAAAARGRGKVVDMLLKNGVDINLVSGQYGTALQAAVAKCEVKVVDMLLKSGAAVNLVSGEHGTALQAAAYSCCEEVVDLLLKNGADVNLAGGKHGTALQAAAYWGGGGVADLLLKNGAHVNLVRGRHGTALQAAAAQGREGVVAMLLQNGADVNLVSGKYDTALQAAAIRWGHERVVDMLLKNGADANLVGRKYRTALQAAAARGDEKVVDLLLKNGADANLVSGKYVSALQAAARGGYGRVVNMLLKNGAKMATDRWGGDYHKVLLAAVRERRWSAVEIFVEAQSEFDETESNWEFSCDYSDDSSRARLHDDAVWSDVPSVRSDVFEDPGSTERSNLSRVTSVLESVKRLDETLKAEQMAWKSLWWVGD